MNVYLLVTLIRMQRLFTSEILGYLLTKIFVIVKIYQNLIFFVQAFLVNHSVNLDPRKDLKTKQEVLYSMK